MTIRILAPVAAALAAVIAVAGCAAPGDGGITAGAPSGDDASTSRTITVTGTGTASGTPDTATINLGVETRAEDAGAALEANNKAAKDVIDTLKGAGIGEKDLQTSQLSIYPTWSDNGSTINGYQVSNFVTATIRDLTQLGGIIDAAQQTAGNAIRLNGIQFSFDDDSDLRAQARTAAVAQAMTTAGQLADAADLTVGEIVSIVEGPAGFDGRQLYAAMDDAAGGMPIEAGSQDLTINVTVTVAIG